MVRGHTDTELCEESDSVTFVTGCLSDSGPGNVWDETGLNGLSWVDDLNKLLIRPWLSGLFNFFLGGMVKTKVNNSWSAIVTAQTMFTICSVRTDQWRH